MPSPSHLRRTVDVPPKRRNPIPACVVIGKLILPSVIRGWDPVKLQLSADPDEQIGQAFDNMKNILEAAGATTDNVGKITVYLTDFAHREYVNKAWVRIFPDADNRPSRHVMKADVQGGAFIELDVIASFE